MSQSWLITPLESQYFYDNLQHGLKPQDTRLQLQQVGFIFFQLINVLTEQREKQVFIGWFSKINFVIQAYNLDADWEDRLQAVRRLIRKYNSQPRLVPEPQEIKATVWVVAHLIDQFAEQPIPEKLQAWLPDTDLSCIIFKQRPEKVVSLLYATFLEKTAITYEEKTNVGQSEVTCNTEAFGKVTITVTNIRYGSNYTHRLTQNLHYLRKFQSVYFTQLEVLDDHHFLTTDDTLIVASPDYLVDASAIARCVHFSGNSPYLYLLNKLTFTETKPAMLAGNLVNDLLDSLVVDPEIAFAEAAQQAFNDKSIDCALYDRDTLKQVYEQLKKQFYTLKNQVTAFKEHAITTDPCFISPVYGLQGRIDALIEYREEHHRTRKDIFELKSTKRPAHVAKVAHENELIQVACYNLLLDSTFPDRNGISAVLYSQDAQHPLRDCGKLNFQKQKAMMLRNRIVSLDYEVAQANGKVFDHLLARLEKAKVPPFVLKDARIFQEKWEKASPLVKAYFSTFCGLVAREALIAKVGGVTRAEAVEEGFATLWKSSLEEKKSNFIILSHLTVQSFDEKERKLQLQRPSPTITSFRVGDIIVLYPHEQEDTFPLRQQILKGNIAEITPTHLVLSLRNRFIDAQFFERFPFWAIEPDMSEQGFQYQFASLASFLGADEMKQRLLLGLEAPRFEPHFTFQAEEVSPEQNDILRQALSAKDYFLLQGPPGTGKTSKMIKNLVKYLYEQTEETIVLLAFTNRATDEICQKVAQITPDFIRLGYVNDAHAFAPQNLHHAESIQEVRKRLQTCRIFVSTVTSFYRYMHLGMAFDTVILDEASQLLEPHLCGILTRFKRFILVGDEKQLPAVITQPTRYQAVEDTHLSSIQINNLSVSLFERLLYNAQQKGWQQAYRMLSTQFRTHRTIADFINKEFYKTLQHGSPRQTQPLTALKWYDSTSEDPLERLLATSRLLFLPSEKENNFKFHRKEAQQVVKLLHTLRRVLKEKGQFDSDAVGVITPYRAQIAEIYQLLDEELRQMVTVDTVERYQGSERDIIIVSMAVNSPVQMHIFHAFTPAHTAVWKLNVSLSSSREQ